MIFHLAKGMNPIACSQACANARNAPGKKAVLLFLDDFHEAAHSVENIAWQYDTDLELLNDPSIVQVIEAGPRHWDTYVRLLLAGVPEEKMVHGEDIREAARSLQGEAVDTVVVLYDLYAVDLAQEIRLQLREQLQALPPLPGKEGKNCES